ncbi:VOC family protein [Kribbella sp. NBC_01505]|uniref:VOC family protein n=1 Tax=Kribbella sp. NBC_01505 TaxID=2903580 RepID=UPI003864F18C
MISHVELNVSNLQRSVSFYQTALAPLGFVAADSSEEYARLSNCRDAVIVLCPVSAAYEDRGYHRRGIGLGHLALAVAGRQLVDDMAARLDALGIDLLGDGLVELGYRRGYYTLAFEDPDRIMIEIVHHDPYYYAATPWSRRPIGQASCPVGGPTHSAPNRTSGSSLGR